MIFGYGTFYFNSSEIGLHLWLLLLHEDGAQFDFSLDFPYSNV